MTMTMKVSVAAVLAVCAVLMYSSVAFAGVTKVGVCHATGSVENPYVFISVSDTAFPAHEAHGDFLAPENGDCSGSGGGGGDPSPM